MNYQLVALDMDGTLLKEDKSISERNQAAIKAAREAGKNVIIATGRPSIGLIPYIEQLDMKGPHDYVVAFNGALVKHIQSGEVIFSKTVTHQDYEALFALSQEYGVHIHALTDEYVTTPKKNPYTQVEADINSIEIKEWAVQEVPKDDVLVKIMFIDDPKKLDAVEAKLPPEYREKYTVVRSAPIFLEFLNPAADKGVGVKAVAERENVPRESVICVGDADNDKAMILYAGLGVAMGNAVEPIKKIANTITDDNESDGVAKVIEKYML